LVAGQARVLAGLAGLVGEVIVVVLHTEAEGGSEVAMEGGVAGGALGGGHAGGAGVVAAAAVG